MPQLVLAISLSESTYSRALRRVCATSSAVSPGVIGHVDRAEHHSLAADHFNDLKWNIRVVGLQRYGIDGGRLQQRERLLVVAPLGAQSGSPIVVRLDAGAEADMYDCHGFKPLARTFQSGDAPVGNLVNEDVEGRLIKLDDIHSGGFQLAGFLIQDGRELPSQLFGAAVVRIVQSINHCYRARKGPPDLAVGTGAQELGDINEDWLFTLNSADHGRHARIVAFANARGLTLFEVNTAQVLDEHGDNVLAGLLQHCCTNGDLLALDQRRAFQLPTR